MSQWTHVAGIVRLDTLILNELDNDEFIAKIKESFGKTCSFESNEEEWDSCTVPCGSEGSLHYKIDHTGDMESISWGVVYIWGDLRDYNDENEIFEWLKNSIKDFFVRQCCINIGIEREGNYVIYLNDDILVMRECEQ